VLACALSFSSHANQHDDELVTINMHNAEVTAVIQWLAEISRKRIVIDPRVKGKVTILANEPMTTPQAYEVFLAMLNVYGYAASEYNGVLRIYPASAAAATPSAVLKDFDKQPRGEQVVHVINVHNVSATKLAALLKPLVRVGGQLVAFPESNSLLMADQAGNIERLHKLVQQMDQTGNLDFQVVAVQHANAKDVVGVLESLLNTENLALTLASDERSNSVLMTGDKLLRHRAAKLIKQLDSPVSSGGNTRVIYLHYLDAQELVPILRGMSEALVDEKDAASDDFSIEASESANALVVTASPALLENIEQVVQQIDIRRAQVLVEAIVVEVSQDYAERLGVEWNTSLSNGDGLEAGTNFGLRSIDANGEVSILGQGLSLGFFRNGSLRAVLQALSTETEANILSTPSIVTLDNQEAEILVGSNVPFITGSYMTSVENTDNSTNPFNTITREDIGLTLRITPQINQGDFITLDVLQEIETISEATTVANDIVTNKRSIRTKVIVEDENILVLGGLISDEIQQIENKVPLLGDIPLLGGLFRSTSESITKKNLMVFIHPVIVDSDEIAREVSSKNYNLMRELQEKYNSGKFATKKTTLPDFTEYTPQSEK
jgi:general secretion pathway protein D